MDLESLDSSAYTHTQTHNYYIVSLQSTIYADFYLFEQIRKNYSESEKDVFTIRSIEEITHLDQIHFPVLVKIIKNIVTMSYAESFSYKKIKLLHNAHIHILNPQKILTNLGNVYSIVFFI
jgi:hypothetical protein